MNVLRYQKDEVIVREGRPCFKLYQVAKGSVRVCLDWKNDAEKPPYTVDTLGIYTTFGEVNLMLRGGTN